MFYTFSQSPDLSIPGYYLRSSIVDGHVIVEGVDRDDINRRANEIGLEFGTHWNPMKEGWGHDSWCWSMELFDVQTPKSTTIVYFMDGTVKYSNQNWTA